MKLFPVRTQALRLPALVLVCLLLVLGAVLGFAVCRAVPQQDRQELSDYLHQYAQATADGRGPSASALSVAAAYFRYPLAAALLGLTAAGLVLLPVLALIFLVCLVPTGMVSLGSITMAAAYPVMTLVYSLMRGLLTRDVVVCTVGAAIMGGMVIWMHRSNIQRIRDGKEYRFGQKHKSN